MLGAGGFIGKHGDCRGERLGVEDRIAGAASAFKALTNAVAVNVDLNAHARDGWHTLDECGCAEIDGK